MAKAPGEIRQSQVITTFGPGALIDLPNHSVIVAGLDGINTSVEIVEPRLLQKIKMIQDLKHVESLKSPPAQQTTFGEDTTGMVSYKFPYWFVTTKIQNSSDRYLVPGNKIIKRKFIDDDGEKYPVVPVRFLRACKHGHIDDIDWKKFIHHGSRECNVPIYRFTETGSSGDASDIIVSCSCGQSRLLEEAKEPSKDGLGFCNGQRPWLGFDGREECHELSRLVIRNASNVYFPQVMGVISIPFKENITLGDKVFKHFSCLEQLEDEAELKVILRTQPEIKVDFQGDDLGLIWKCLTEIKKTGQNSENVSVKDAEFETLFSSEDEIGKDWPVGNFYSKAIKKDNWGKDSFMKNFSRLVLVHRLREVRALIGFTRIDKLSLKIDGEFDDDDTVHRASLSLGKVPWVPAVENRGEGIFIGFDKVTVEEWANRPKVIERSRQLIDGMRRLFLEREKEFEDREDFPGITYYMLHSFSHMLITAVALECGYPASSIKERIYCSERGYGILLYTGSPDAEGTLGGLIEAGRNIHKYIKMALEMGELCSSDPVCSQHRPDHTFDDKYLLGAACHGCLLIAETSCEMSNNHLDRSLVVPTLENLGCEFFKME